MLIAVEVLDFLRHVFVTVVLVESVESNLEMLEVNPVHLRHTFEEVTLDVEHSAQLPVPE